jgi:hypothetical protein
LAVSNVELHHDLRSAVGEQTEAILRELGYDLATVTRWRREGVV